MSASDVATHLREAYASVDRTTLASVDGLNVPPAILDLFTVTINLEAVLKHPGPELRQKLLDWNKCVFNTLYTTHNPSQAFSTYVFFEFWAKGVILYEYNEIKKLLGNNRDALGGEALIPALHQAVELWKGLGQIKKLAKCLFYYSFTTNDEKSIDKEFDELFANLLDDRANIETLEFLLKRTLQYRHHMQPKTPGSTVNPEKGPEKEMFMFFSTSLCELIKLSACKSRHTEEKVMKAVLKTVVDDCKKLVPHEKLLPLLQDASSDKNCLEFLITTWLNFRNAEIGMVSEFPCVKEGDAKHILVKHTFLWEVGNDVVTDNSGKKTFDINRTFASHLIRKIVTPQLQTLFAHNSTAEESVRAETHDMLIRMAENMACIEIEEIQKVRLWNEICEGPELPAGIEKDIGYAIMSGLIRELLEPIVNRAVDYFLSSNDIAEEERWPKFIAYLIRSERVFDHLGKVRSLKMRLLDSETGMMCFYSIIGNILKNNRQQSRVVETFIETLADGIHIYLLNGPQGKTEARRGGGGGGRPGAPAVAAVCVRDDEDIKSAMRLVRTVTFTERFAYIHQQLLAYRLLTIGVKRKRDSGLDADEARREKLDKEQFFCQYLQEQLPMESERVRKMIQMCMDIGGNSDGQEMHDYQDQGEGKGVKYTLRFLAHSAWPTYTELQELPQPLRKAVEQFEQAHKTQHENRRVAWLGVPMETITFNVAYPQGGKVIVGTMELFQVFSCLSEAGSGGVTWDALAQRVGKKPDLLRRELRKLIADGFFAEVKKDGGDCLVLNLAFTSRQSTHRFLHPPPRAGILSEEHRIQADKERETLISSIQTVIIKTMKTERTCMYEDLLRKTQEALPNTTLQTADFKSALEMLIEKEYVERDLNKKQMFIYKA